MLFSFLLCMQDDESDVIEDTSQEQAEAEKEKEEAGDTTVRRRQTGGAESAGNETES